MNLIDGNSKESPFINHNYNKLHHYLAVTYQAKAYPRNNDDPQISHFRGF